MRKPKTIVSAVRYFQVVSPANPDSFLEGLSLGWSSKRSALDGDSAALHHAPACLLEAQGDVLGCGLCLWALQDAPDALDVGHLAEEDSLN